MRHSRLIPMLAFLILVVFTCDGNAQFGRLKKKATGGSSGAVDVDDVLWRAKRTKRNFQGATRCLNLSRDILFDIAATSEKKDQLKAKEAELAAASADEEKERITIEIQQMKDEEIERARKSGELEKKKLNVQQLKNTGKLAFNLLLAIKKDKSALDDGRKLKDEGPQAIKNARKDRRKALKMATKIKELSGVIKNDIPTIIAEAPKQIKTLQAFLAATKVLKKHNKVEDLGEPKGDDEFEEIDF